MIKLKNKFIILILYILLIGNIYGQSYYYDFDQDGLSDSVILEKENLTITVSFGNHTVQKIDIPEIASLSNIKIKYKNPCELSVFYSGDRGLYSALNLYYKKGWFIKDVNYYSPCQECEDQNYKILSKIINLPLYRINSDLLNVDASNFKYLKFYDYESILNSYTNIKKVYADLKQFYLLSNCFNKYIILDFRKKFILSNNNLEDYNNIAYVLSMNGNQEVSIELLREILKKFPDRVVAYLNLADSYWAIGNQELAKENYKKYVELMKFQNKDLKKIPKEVWARVK